MVAPGRPVARSFAGARDLGRADLLGAPVHWPRPSVLEQGLGALKGVGPKTAEAAAEAGIRRVGDLLFHVPRRHRDLRIRRLGDLQPGETATVAVEVQGSQPRPFRKGRLRMVSVKVGDESGHVRATWFNQPWVASKLTPGTELLLTGKYSGKGFAVREWELGSPGASEASPEGMVPIHGATETIRAQQIREWVAQAVAWAPNAIEGLPSGMRARRRLAGLGDALRVVHFPETAEDVDEARRRLGFEELFLHQALLATRKRSHRTARPAPRFGGPGELVARWLESLPFEPTGDQLQAFVEIEADLDSGQPMQRLLMGEVGSGKTVVALYSMLRALEAGYQATLMAPTETLAEQHAITLGRLLAEEAIPFALLTGATPAATRGRALDQLASGELGLILGTHALIEPTVEFARLGLCVVDEQHRFGVGQRRALDEKGVEGMAPHVLHMTATPIPRTLSLTEYGDLDATALHELPAGRQPVSTHLVSEEQRGEAFEFLRRELREGRQAFVVCPLVGESEKVAGKAAAVEAERLRKDELREFRVGLLHGQMHSNDKAEAMRAFAVHETDVLVSTTVIEVGIDVPNATVMVIEGAERFGVSQLHQLRGRVGRGTHPSQCLLFAEEAGETAQKRLQAVAEESDGFRLAEIDLELRGAGEILGTRQSGLPRFAVARLPDDGPLLMEAHREVLALLSAHGSLSDPALGPLLDAAHARFGTGAADPIPL
ncbi:MAG TPA: ATP-dependent DNA helicase RecG [Solirubrobacterales bacterium]|nr:ATP-dependent DNA helicase RecG [Solirubrobacterales bacterium]